MDITPSKLERKPGGQFCTGHSVSDEMRRKMSLSHKGKKFSNERRQNMAKAHLGLKRTEEQKRKMSIAAKNSPLHYKPPKGKMPKNLGINFGMSGELNPSWKGGITPINHQIRSSVKYKSWRKSIFERDNYTCIWCGARSGKGKSVILNADHIKPFALFPELRFAINNGRTLCADCHRITDTFAKRNERTFT